MSGLKVLGDVLSRGLGDWKLWVLHVVLNPLLFVLFAGWLLIPESSGWRLGLSIAGVIVLAVAALVLHSSTLGYLALRQQPESVPHPLLASFTRALRNLIAFALCAALAYLLWNSASFLDLYRITLPTYLRSAMPTFLRRQVSAEAIASACTAIVFVIRWVLLPGALLPLVASVASCGFAGFVRAGSPLWRAVRSGWYWLVIATAAFLGVVLTSALVVWHPLAPDASFAREGISMAIRFSAAFGLAVASWLAACSMAGAELQRISQSGVGAGSDTALCRGDGSARLAQALVDHARYFLVLDRRGRSALHRRSSLK
jgi:hypothetical protein